MSGDEIIMDYYSRLGPIDPQVKKQKRTMGSRSRLSGTMEKVT
jgi:hypothetical protein